MNIILTGCCGFIGYHLTKKILLNKRNYIIGVDNINNYYSSNLKKKRLKELKNFKNFYFFKKDIRKGLDFLSYKNKKKIDIIIHLSAQPGVRASFRNPETYFSNNILSFFNICEFAKKKNIKNILTASSSSVYGQIKDKASEEKDNAMPENFYALTKLCNEKFSEYYSRVFSLNITCVRFFTVYGPMGRPDMFIWKMCDNIFFNKKINIHNNGKHLRDFTYIDDAIAMLMKIIKNKNLKKFNIFNICNSRPEKLSKVLTIFKKIKKLRNINFIPFQKGEVKNTHGSNKKFTKKFGAIKSTSLEDGILRTVKWYKYYYKIK